MSAPLIRRSKLRPPEPAGHDVRARALCPSGGLPAVTVLVAGPGYGKSTAAARLAAESGLPTVWYGLDPSDRDLSTFFAYLTAAVQAQARHVGPATAAMLASAEATPAQVAGTFVAELEMALLPGLLIVIDDCHHVDGHGPIQEALAFLAEHLPESVRLVVTSRVRPAFRLARLKARGRVLELAAADLALDEADQAAFWRAETGQDGPPDGLRELARAVEGWPLGLVMLAGLGAGAGTPEPGTALHEVLIEEVLAQQTPATRELLQRAAWLEQFDGRALAAMGGPERTEGLLAGLEAQAMVVSVPGEPGVFRLHALLREVLQRTAEREQPPAVLAAWRLAAGESLVATAPELAIGHLLAAGADGRALEVARRAFPPLWAAGRWETLERWVAQFSASTADLVPQALLWRGRLAERRAELAEAERLYRAALDRAVATADDADRFAAATRLACLGASQGRDEALAWALAEAAPLVARGRPGDVCDWRLAQALAAERRGDLAGAEAHNRAVIAMPIAGDPDVAHAQGIALLNLAAQALNRGAAAEADSWLQTLLALVEREALPALRTPALLYRGILQQQAGDWVAVGATLASLPARWDAELAWQDAGLAHELAASHAMAGRQWPRAREHLALAARVYERAGSPAGLKGVADGHIRLAGKQGLWQEAQRRFEACRPLRDDDLHDLQISLSYAAVRLAAGDDAAAAAMLEPLTARLPEEWAYQRAYAGLLHGLAANRPDRLEEAVRLMSAGGFEALLGEHEALFPRLVAAIAPLPGGRELAERAAERAGLLIEAPVPRRSGAWPPESRLTVRCFGPMEVTLGDRPMTEWQRKKAKVLLAMLLVYPRGLHRAELARALYGDTALAEQNFRPIITALRTLLEPDLAPRAPSRYVLIDSEHVRLAPEAIGYLDLAQFQAARERAAAARRAGRAEEAVAAAREILALYRGELLAEPFMAAYFEPERERYRREAQAELRHLAHHHLESGEVEPALAPLQRLLELDPLSGEDVLLLIRAHLRQGGQELARFAYWDYRNRLKRLVGEAPDEAFERAYRALGV